MNKSRATQLSKAQPKWEVEFHDEFREELKGMDVEQKKSLYAAAGALEEVGPNGERPLVGTLDNPKHPNMKELRYEAHGGSQVWRAAFAFDPERKAIVLVAGDKQGADEKSFYKALLKKANKRFDDHLAELKAKKKTQQKATKEANSSNGSQTKKGKTK